MAKFKSFGLIYKGACYLINSIKKLKIISKIHTWIQVSPKGNRIYKSGNSKMLRKEELKIDSKAGSVTVSEIEVAK